MKRRAAVPRDPKCPCRSGRLRRTCDPAPLVCCIEGDCDNLFHQHSNAAKRCPACRVERMRTMEREKKRRQRQRAREARAAGAPVQLELEDVA